MNVLIDIFFSGVFQGSLYAIMAVGLALIWTTTGVFNFAHGILIMLGAYVCWYLMNTDVGIPLVAAIPLSLAVVAALGWCIERFLVKPFIGRKDLVLIVVIMTLAASSFFENAVLGFSGSRPKQLPPLLEGTTNFLGKAVSLNQLVIIALAPLILAGVWALLHRTRIGLGLRAVAQNNEASLLIGLDPAYLFGLTFALAAALAALAGIFIGSFKFMSPVMGTEPLTKALIVVIFGGIGSINGSIVAAYIIGIIEAFLTYYVGLYWTPSILFLILIGSLMIRPEGLLAVKGRGLS
ncbi:branched-chain amino acid ABC transporter permease [Mesorhizobium sp. AaZ16]|uniref:branched-chain amino acid ABC transporter permease n=1 Tax=Mesorhizobium sp. AaZ16 TaxID=3402289 RepID=UPI00374F858E